MTKKTDDAKKNDSNNGCLNKRAISSYQTKPGSSPKPKPAEPKEE